MLAKKAGRSGARGENHSYWMSYSDMMAALLLMFVLLLFLSFTRYMGLQETKEKELADKEGQLQAQEAQLQTSREEVAKHEQELAALRAALNTQQFEVNMTKTELATSREELEQSLAQLILQQKQIEEQEALLAMSQEEIEAARAQLDARSQELDDLALQISAKDAALLIEQLRVTDLETLLNQQAVRIDELVGVRARIIEQLRDTFVREGLNVSVDRNSGAITMDSTVFFDTDRTTIKPEGRALLTQFLPIYFRTLMSEENAEFVSEIIIEGHTDSAGSYEHNLDLSQRRAQAVVNFCMSDESGLDDQEKEMLRSMITANGRSYSQLIYDESGAEDRAASRRVEIKFRLKDAEMIESMGRILSEIQDER